MRLLRLLPWLLACAAFALAGVWSGARLAGPIVHETPLGDVRLEAAPAWRGGVDAYVPLADWGARARTWRAPVQLRLEPRTLRRDRLVAATSGDRELLRATQRSVRSGARHALLRAALLGLAGAAVAAALAALLGSALRRPARACAGLAAGVLALAGLGQAAVLWRVQASFDATALERPTFYGRGEEVLQLVKAAGRAREAGAAYSSRIEASVSAFASLLADPLRSGGAATGPRLIAGSDLHNNGLVLDGLEPLAAGATVFLVGDFGIDGAPGERALLRRAATLGARVVAVSGNHDSDMGMRELARGGALVLRRDGVLGRDGRVAGSPVVEVAGLRVAGFDDPLEDRTGDPGRPDRIFSFPERPDGDAELAAAKAGLVAWFDGLPERPDLVLVHQNGLAQHLGRTLAARGDLQPLTVLTGHDHRQHVDLHGAVAVIDAGTLGAGGVLGAGTERVGLASLVLDGRRVVATDLVRTDPFTGAAQGERVLLDGCPEPGETSCRLADPDRGRDIEVP